MRSQPQRVVPVVGQQAPPAHVVDEDVVVPVVGVLALVAALDVFAALGAQDGGVLLRHRRRVDIGLRLRDPRWVVPASVAVCRSIWSER